MVFQLLFEIIKWIRQLQVLRKTLPNYWRQVGQFFLPEHVSLKGCFSFKISYLLDFDQIVSIYHENNENIEDKFP